MTVPDPRHPHGGELWRSSGPDRPGGWRRACVRGRCARHRGGPGRM